jgi:DNA replication protein DnaC
MEGQVRKAGGKSLVFSEETIRASEERKKEREEREAAAQRAARNEQAIDLLISSGVGDRHMNKRLDDLVMPDWVAALNRAEKVIKRNCTLALLSPTRGNGKTQMAVELIRACCQSLEPALYVRAVQIFMAAKETFDGPGRESLVLAHYASPHLLVIDELQGRLNTDYENLMLTTLIDLRYVDMKPTVLVANLDEKEFRTHVGPSITDRIIEGGGCIEFDWPSFREAQ